MNIYISNLSYDVTDANLQELFEAHGNVSSAKVINDRMTGRSRGFGFVEMPDDAAAQQAIDKLNQFEHYGKVINVSVARPKTDKPREFSGGSRSGGGGGFNRGGGNFRNSR